MYRLEYHKVYLFKTDDKRCALPYNCALSEWDPSD